MCFFVLLAVPTAVSFFFVLQYWEHGFTPLHFAAENGNVHLIKLLLDYNFASVDFLGWCL